MEPWLLSAVRRDPHKTALITPERAITYEDLYASAARSAKILRAGGTEPCDRVAIALPSGESFAGALHGTLLLGAIAVPIDLRLGAREQLQRAEGALLVDSPADPGAGGSGFDPFRPALDAPATIVHTSGTSSSPKPVVLSYRNWLASALGSVAMLGLERNEHWLCPMPLVHVGGLSVLIRSAIYGTTVTLHERFDTAKVIEELMDRRRGITLVSLVPTMLARLLDAGLRQPPSLRWVLLGGAPIPASLLARAAAAGVPVAPSYGMTEACSQIATNGWPLPGVEVALEPDGEILVRGDTVSEGAVGPDGWLRTGDLGSFDERGRITITGRKSDTIVTGGENVAPDEVEAVLLEHRGVADAGVFARPDADWGEKIVAVVVPRDRARISSQELLAHCAASLASFKVPKEVRFAQRLPRSASGKLLRRELASRE